jgi:hypothetical protein
MKKVLLIVTLFLGVSLVESFSQHRWVGGDVLKFDPSGYYLYLPAAFIYHDLTELSFYPQIDERYHPSGDVKWYAIYQQPDTKKRLNKYPIGVALGELPLFLITDGWMRLSKDYPRDGYSTPYQFAVGISTILWAVLGLLVLGRFLLRLFSQTSTLITLFLIGFGTNLYCYTSYELGMPHALLFLLFACVLNLTERWYTTGRVIYACLLGLILGWIAVTRPIDIAIATIPVLWPLSKDTKRWQFLKHRWTHLLIAGIAGFAIIALQLLYWKAVTGHFVYYSYQGEYFDFRHPHIIDGLFSYRKGWFVYTPLAFLGALGFITLYKVRRGLVLPLLLFFIVSCYLIFSWHQWYYGWGFGCRSLVASLAVLSIPLAALVSWLLKQRRVIKVAGVVVAVLLIALNIFQTNQYASAVIEGDGMTKAYYWRVFGKMEATPKDKELLDRTP